MLMKEYYAVLIAPCFAKTSNFKRFSKVQARDTMIPSGTLCIRLHVDYIKQMMTHRYPRLHLVTTSDLYESRSEILIPTTVLRLHIRNLI